MAIPKLIHQTYISRDLPPEIFEIVEGLKGLNPDWEYRFYTDEDIFEYIQKNFDEKVLTAYLKINPIYGAAKADLFRYLVLYKEGGVYLDIKSTCIHPLSTVVRPNDQFVITQWQNELGDKDEGAGLFRCLTEDLNIKNGEYQQWFIIAEKNSPIMKHIVDTVVNNILNYRAWNYKFHSYGKRGVLFVTGPIAYTKAVHSLQNKYPIRFERYDKDIGFVYNALKNKLHTKVLAKHYAKYKSPVVNQGFTINFISCIYIVGIRLVKNTLKAMGGWKR